MVSFVGPTRVYKHNEWRPERDGQVMEHNTRKYQELQKRSYHVLIIGTQYFNCLISSNSWNELLLNINKSSNQWNANEQSRVGSKQKLTS